MTLSGILPWLGWEGDGNEFVYYLMGGYSLVYLICLILTVANRRTQPSIVLIPPTEDVEDEKTLHKYILTVHTSQQPGCSFPTGLNIFIQLVGEKVKSQFYKVKVFSADRFLFQKGAVDILLFKTKGFLGHIKEVKILVTGEDHLKWRATEMEVLCLTTRKRYTVGFRLLNNGSVTHTHDEVVYPCQTQRKRGHMRSVWIKVVLYHHWFCSASHCVRYGKFTALVNVILLFLSISLIMMGTLAAYIVTSYNDVKDVFSLQVMNITAAVVVAAFVSTIILSIDLLFRNMKSGNQKILDDLFPKKSVENTQDAVAGISPWCMKNSEYKFPDLDKYISKQSLSLSDQSDFKESVVNCAIDSFLSLNQESRMFESIGDIVSKSYISRQSNITPSFQSVAHVESCSSYTDEEERRDTTIKKSEADKIDQDDTFTSITSIHIPVLESKDDMSFATLASDSMYTKSIYDWSSPSGTSKEDSQCLSRSDFHEVTNESVTSSAEVGKALEMMQRDDRSENIIKTEHICVQIDESDSNEERQQHIQHPSKVCSQKTYTDTAMARVTDDTTLQVSKPSFGISAHRSHSKTCSDYKTSQQQRMGQVKAFMKWLLQDIVTAVKDTKQSILMRNKGCGLAGDSVVSWHSEMQLQTLLHINHRYQINKIINKDKSTSKYTEVKTDFPAVLVKHVILEVIKRLAVTGRLAEAAQEETIHDAITQLDRYVTLYLEDHKPTDQCVDVKALSGESRDSVLIHLTKREPPSVIPTSLSVRTDASSWSWTSTVSTIKPSRVKRPQIVVTVESDLSTVPSSQSQIYKDMKSYLPDVVSMPHKHSEKTEVTVDQESPDITASDQTIVCDVGYTCTPDKGKMVTNCKDNGISVSSKQRSCDDIHTASDHRYLDCPYSTSDITQYNTSQKILQVSSHVSAPNVDFTSNSRGVDKSENLSLPHECSKPEDSEELIQLKIFFLHQVLKLLYITHSNELNLSKLDRVTARLAYNLVKNAVHQECRHCDQVCKDTELWDEELAILSLCDSVVDQAKHELWSEYQDPVCVYSQFLVRQTVLSSLKRFRKRFSGTTFCMEDVIRTVSKCWHKQGFHSSLNASRNLAQTLLSCHIDNSMKTSKSFDQVYNNILTLGRLEKQLTETLQKHAKWLLCLWWSQREIKMLLSTSKSLNDISDWINAVTDVVTQKMVICLPVAVQNTVTEEIQIYAAFSMCQGVICSAMHQVTLESQLASFPETLTMNEEVVNMIKANLAPVRGYLRYITLSQNVKSRQRVENSYIQKYQLKHQNFAVVNLQRVVDSYCIKDEENVDNTLSTDVLYELEWHVMHENTKIIPGLFKNLVVFLLFCWTLLNTVYTTVTGAYLTVTQIQEWVTSLLICVLVYGLLLEPLCAIVIGGLEERHKRKSHKNERVVTQVT